MSAVKGIIKMSTSALRAFGKCSVEKAEQQLPPVSVSRPAVSGDCFTVGFGRRSILPRDIRENTYYIAGYGENNPATGVLDPPYASVVYLDDNSGLGGVLLISLDAVGLLNSDVERVRARLKPFCESVGCRSVNVMCTHNHAGIDTMGIWGRLPFTGRNPKYMEFLFDCVVEAAKQAYAQRRDGDLYSGSIEVPDMQEDVRLPKVYSKLLTRFRFVPRDGGRELYIVNFASHSESLQGSNTLVSADFPAYFRQEIAEKTGADTIYFVGAVGGMITMQLMGKNYVRSTKAIGKRLAGYALSIENETKLEPKILIARQEFFVAGENTVLLMAQKLRILSAKAYGAEWSPSGWALKTEMSYIKIGSKAMLLLPCELFPELAYGGYLSAEESANGTGGEVNPKPLCEIAGDEDLLIFGLANDELGYVLPPNDFLLNPDKPYIDNARDRLGRKHYEETNSLGPGTAERLAQVFERIIKYLEE